MTAPHTPGAAARITHVVNVSGGKDSTAVYMLALLRGRPFRAVMADTGHEHPVTMEYAMSLPRLTGGPEIEIVRAAFGDRIAARREYVATAWRAEGVPEATIERVLAVLRPTGNPFIDLTLWKGRFPSRKAQFCTEFLKREAVDLFLAPLIERGRVVQWLGVRRDESQNRRNAPFVHRAGRMTLFRPLIHWTARNVFGFTKALGVPPNPLYLLGAGRVGCWPCINSGKDDLRMVRRIDHAAADRLMEWEALVKAAAKQGAATFFAPDVTPEGAALARRLKKKAAAEAAKTGLEGKALEREVTRIMSDLSAKAPWPQADQVFDWARTGRGGRTFDMLNLLEDRTAEDEGLSCSSMYGLCE